jgi:hypothetical protein
MKKLLLLVFLAVVTVNCTPNQVEEVQTTQGTLSFKFKGINYTINHGEVLYGSKSSVLNIPFGITTAPSPTPTPSILTISSYGLIAPKKLIRCAIAINKEDVRSILIEELDNGTVIKATTIENPVITFVSQTQKRTSVKFSGDGLENGVGTNIENRFATGN